MMKLAKKLNVRERAMFADIRQVFKQYPDLEGAFGLWRIHSHFAMGEDEVLSEVSDTERRESVVTPRNRGWLDENAVETQWIFDRAGEPVATTYCGVCRD